MEKSYKNYVCPECFNTIDKCECKLKPYHLIMIDNGIQEHIRTVRAKGYLTTGCCESHDEICLCIYISFDRDYGFGNTIPLPDGFIFNRGKYSVVYNFKKNLLKEEIQAIKKKKLDELLKWCKNLPNNN